MGQIIGKRTDCGINILWYKYYVNDRGQLHGLFINYWNKKIDNKRTYVNDKKYNIETWYNCDGKTNIQFIKHEN